MPILPAVLVFLLGAPPGVSGGASAAAPATSSVRPRALAAAAGASAASVPLAALPLVGLALVALALVPDDRPSTPGSVRPTDGSGRISVSARLDAGLAAQAPGPARAVWASGLLGGGSYRHSPLGEGSGPDPDPRFRLDAFDCVTLVETAIALGNARSTAEARVLLDDIRYDGPPDFQRRNHYLEAQWLPANLRKGWIEEATERIGGELAMHGEKRHTSATWKAAARAGTVVAGLEPRSLPLGRFPLPFVPIDHLSEIAPRIPEGTLLLVVREERPWRPYRVTHLGIVVVGAGGARFLRHASDVPGVMRVRDEPLLRFAARSARARAWPVVGVSLWAIRDASGRAAEVLREAAGR